MKRRNRITAFCIHGNRSSEKVAKDVELALRTRGFNPASGDILRDGRLFRGPDGREVPLTRRRIHPKELSSHNVARELTPADFQESDIIMSGYADPEVFRAWGATHLERDLNEAITAGKIMEPHTDIRKMAHEITQRLK